MKQGEWNLVGLFHRSAVAQVACGVFHTMFLMQTSEVYAIGRGDWGLLGMGDRMDRKAPCKITELQVRCAVQPSRTRASRWHDMPPLFQTPQKP